MASYREHALDGASPVELVVALYDGIIRFLYVAITAVECDDVHGRRIAVKRALAIIIHLQARLRMDIGGRPAEVLSEYYASIFALILQASVGNSAERFEDVIGCVRTIRDTWRQVAAETPREPLRPVAVYAPQVARMSPPSSESEPASRWTA